MSRYYSVLVITAVVVINGLHCIYSDLTFAQVRAD